MGPLKQARYITKISFKFITSNEETVRDKIYVVSSAGGYHYLNISKPGLRLPLESQMAQPEYVRT